MKYDNVGRILYFAKVYKENASCLIVHIKDKVVRM